MHNSLIFSNFECNFKIRKSIKKLGYILFIIKDFFEFLFYLIASQSSSEDGAVGGEEEHVGDAVHAVELQDRHSGVENLRIWNVLLTDIFDTALRIL